MKKIWYRYVYTYIPTYTHTIVYVHMRYYSKYTHTHTHGIYTHIWNIWCSLGIKLYKTPTSWFVKITQITQDLKINCVSVSHFYVFFGVSVHVFCPFFDVIICLVCVEFEEFFIDLGYQAFVVSFVNIFSHSMGCLFVLLTVSFVVFI